MRSFIATFFLVSLALAAPFKRGSACKASVNKATVINPAGLLWYDPTTSDGTAGRTDASQYVCYGGPATSFPPMSEWQSFDAMWAHLVQVALAPIGDSTAEIADIKTGILQVSQIARVDPRVILAVIVDESTGNVRVSCTNNGVENCGLMQSYNPSDKVYDPTHMQASITQMIVDGTQGTAFGPGLVQLFNNIALTGGNVYEVLRAYNSGKVNHLNLSDPQGATAAYVSNIANFLLGWQGFGQNADMCNF